VRRRPRPYDPREVPELFARSRRNECHVWHGALHAATVAASPGEIKDAVRSLESIQVGDLMKLLGSVKTGQGTPSSSKAA
jgi:hypothetical protein